MYHMRQNGDIMKPNYNELILNQTLFADCDKQLIEQKLTGGGTIRSFRSGEEMKADFSPAVGILLSGRGVIYSADKERSTILRFIAPGNMIGVASVFAKEPVNTRTFACGDGKSEMLFIGRDTFEYLLENEPVFRRNLVEFLADRISFLNSKIDCVTAGNAERKLALFIKSAPTGEDGCARLGMSMTSLAQTLDLSRASLYRAFDSLEADGAISRTGKTVKILSREKLNEIN